MDSKLKEAQKEAEYLIEYLQCIYKLNHINLRVKSIHSGRAIYQTRFISIPFWSYTEGLNYFYYYVIHEFCHFLCYDKFNCYGHSDLFKIYETKLLKDFNLNPIYKKAYVKQLKSDNGMILWSSIKKEV